MAQGLDEDVTASLWFFGTLFLELHCRISAYCLDFWTVHTLYYFRQLYGRRFGVTPLVLSYYPHLCFCVLIWTAMSQGVTLT
jgi:hypothetical protein